MQAEAEAWLSTGLAAALLAAVHGWAGAVQEVPGRWRAPAVSAAGGLSVAYVFIGLLPELAQHESAIKRLPGFLVFPELEVHVYLFALLGLLLFHAVDRWAVRREARGLTSESVVFWGETTVLGLYNLLLGYLLDQRATKGFVPLLLYTLAIGAHLLVSDRSLWRRHPRSYGRHGRYLLIGGLAAGWLVGRLTTVSEVAFARWFSVVGGAILLNVLRAELPAGREGHFVAFALGALAYALVLAFL